VVGLGGERDVAAGGADTEGADAVRVDVVAGREVGDGGADVLRALERVFTLRL